MSSARFNRQEILGAIGMRGQAKLSKATVAIVGVGGVGSVSAELLCRAGVGNLIIFDPDSVHESNLPRQMLYDTSDVGKKKAVAAAARLKKIWPAARVTAHASFLEKKNLSLLDGADVILDGTDNLETRLLVAKYAKKKKKLFIYAGAVETRGMVFPCIPEKNMPTLQDVLGDKRAADSCGTVGILNGTNALAAGIQCMLATRWIVTGKLEPRLHIIDSWNGTVQAIAVSTKKKEE